MTEGHFDDWCEYARPRDQGDWSDWPLWQNRCDQEQWSTTDVISPYSLVAWREDVLCDVNRRRPGMKPRLKSFGERLVIAEIRSVSQGRDAWVYLCVISSEGFRPLKPEEKIKRRPKSLRRNGLRRFTREK